MERREAILNGVPLGMCGLLDGDENAELPPWLRLRQAKIRRAHDRRTKSRDAVKTRPRACRSRITRNQVAHLGTASGWTPRVVSAGICGMVLWQSQWTSSLVYFREHGRKHMRYEILAASTGVAMSPFESASARENTRRSRRHTITKNRFELSRPRPIAARGNQPAVEAENRGSGTSAASGSEAAAKEQEREKRGRREKARKTKRYGTRRRTTTPLHETNRSGSPDHPHRYAVGGKT
jgi:hypothetical protein